MICRDLYVTGGVEVVPAMTWRMAGEMTAIRRILFLRLSMLCAKSGIAIIAPSLLEDVGIS